MKVLKAASTALYPVPAVLVSCGFERPNLITLAWVGTVCSDPPSVGIGVRPSRYSHGLIAGAGEFVVNLPRADQVGQVDYCGNVSGSEVDKWAACGFTPAPAREIRTPIVAECPVALECRVVHRLPLGSHDLFIGQIVAIQVDEELLTAEGRLNYALAQPLAYLGGDYWRLAEPVGHHGAWRPPKGD